MKKWIEACGSASLLALLVGLTAGCFVEGAEDGELESAESQDSALSQVSGAKLWSENGYIVPICWNNPGLDAEKQLAEDALRRTWQANTALEFTFEDSCPTSGTKKYMKIETVEAHGGSWSGFGMSGTFMGPTDSPRVHLEFDASLSPERIEYLIVHEIGHALGFQHEQDRPDNELGPHCRSGWQPSNPVSWLGPYDLDTLMNYCNSSKNNSGELTALDIEAVRAVYGWPGKAIDIAVGTDEAHPWVVGSSKKVFQWDGADWQVRRSGANLAVDVGTPGNAWIVAEDHAIYRQKGNDWERMPGWALDIGVGADDTAWVVGTSGNVFRWNGSGWQQLRTGSHKAIDVGPDGLARVTDNNNVVWEYNGSSWSALPGTALDVGVSSKGTVFKVDAVTREVQSWGGGSWTKVPDSKPNGLRVSAGPNAQAASLDADGRIFMPKRYGWPGNEWMLLDGGARDGGVGADGAIWIVGTSGKVFKLEGQSWTEKRSGDHLAIDVGPDGKPWVVASDHRIYSWDGIRWVARPGYALDVGIGADGTVWVVGTSKNVFRWDGSAWRQQGAGKFVAVDGLPDGGAIATDEQQRAWRWMGASWVRFGDHATDVGIDPSGYEWIVRSDGTTDRVVDDWVAQKEECGNGRDDDGDGYTDCDDSECSNTCSSAGTMAYLSPMRVDASSKSNVWVVSRDNSIHSFDGSQWVKRDGGAVDVAASGAGGAWIVGTSGKVFRWSGHGWDTIREGKHLALSVDRLGRPWVVDSAHRIWKSNGAGWDLVAGSANDIAVGDDGSVFIVDGNQDLARWTGSTWSVVRSGPFLAVDVDGFGHPMVVESTTWVTRFNGVSWQTIHGACSDVALTEGTAFCAHPEPRTNLYRFDALASPWKTAPSAARRVSVGPNNRAVVVDQQNRIWLREPYGIVKAEDLAASEDPHHPWAIDARTHDIVRWDGDRWETMRVGTHEFIDEGSGGDIWTVDDAHVIRRYHDGQWSTIPGLVNQVASGGGKIWVIGTSGSVYLREGTSWSPKKAGKHLAIDVDADGNAWIVTEGRQLRRWDGSSFAFVANEVLDVGIGEDGSVWAIDADGDLEWWNGTSFELYFNAGPRLVRVSAGPNGRVGVVTEQGDLIYL